MAIKYVDDNASGIGDGSTWAHAYTSITSASGAAAGDVLFVASSHDETLAGHTDIGGTVSAPVTIVSATSGSAPAAYAAGATFRGWTTSKTIRPGTDEFVVWWGCALLAEAANYDDLKLGMGNDSASYFFDCTFTARDQLYLTTNNDSYTKHTSCSYEILASSSAGGRYIYQSGTASSIDVRDGQLVNPHQDYAIRKFYGGATRVRACDLSGFSQGYNDGSTSRTGALQFSGCSVGSGFSVSLNSYASKVGGFTAADYCGDGAYGTSDAVAGFTGAVDYYGQTTLDTARFRTDGAVDSLTNNRYSHAVSGRYGTLAEGHNSCELVARVTGGEPVTVTLHLAGAATLYNDEMWFDFFGPSTSDSARQHFTTTRMANPTATRAALASDSASWTGSGVGTKHGISYTYTPHHGGLIHVVPVFAKAGGSVYICPKLTVA